MYCRRSVVAAFALAVTLLGVAGTASATGAFDGTYAGRVINEKGVGSCGRENSWKGEFDVTDNKFRMTIGNHILAGDVRSDGSFETTISLAPGKQLNFNGKIDGRIMRADADTPLCRWRMEMHR